LEAVEAVETSEISETGEAEVTEVVDADQGPWALIITTGGMGKRVPVAQFRLQNRAGLGLRAIKFRKKGDQLAAMQVVGEDDEIILVTNRGIIIRQAVKAISRQSRAATGVRVQRLDEDDAIVAVALVPASGEGTDEEAGELTEAADEILVDASQDSPDATGEVAGDIGDEVVDETIDETIDETVEDTEE